MLILDKDNRKPSNELHTDFRIRKVSHSRCKGRILSLTKLKGKMAFENLQISFCLLLAESQVCMPKGQDSKSVKGRKRKCRHDTSCQVAGNTKTWDFFGDLALAINSWKISYYKGKYKSSAQHVQHLT